MSFQILKLDESCDRTSFECGNHFLDDFLKTKARQNQEKGLNRTFVAVLAEDPSKSVLGFYSISSAQIDLDILPENLKKRLPRHPIPVVRIGRLAVDLKARGKRLGEYLLVDALKRIKETSTQIGIYAVIVDAKDELATRFYEKYGFIRFENERLKLFLPVYCIP